MSKAMQVVIDVAGSLVTAALAFGGNLVAIAQLEEENEALDLKGQVFTWLLAAMDKAGYVDPSATRKAALSAFAEALLATLDGPAQAQARRIVVEGGITDLRTGLREGRAYMEDVEPIVRAYSSVYTYAADCVTIGKAAGDPDVARMISAYRSGGPDAPSGNELVKAARKATGSGRDSKPSRADLVDTLEATLQALNDVDGNDLDRVLDILTEWIGRPIRSRSTD